MKLIAFIVLLIATHAHPGSADSLPVPSPSLSIPNGYHIYSAQTWLGCLEDSKKLVCAPLKGEPRQWISLAGAGLVTAGWMVMDDEIKIQTQQSRTSTTDRISVIMQYGGNSYALVPALALWYGGGELLGNYRMRKTAIVAMESFVYSQILANFIKYALHRHRPDSGDPSNRYNGPSLSTNDAYLSFVSGHATAAFSIASVFATEYRDVVWVPPVAYGLATLVALSRINDNRHWSSDLFAGAILGLAVGTTLSHYAQGKSAITINPVVSPTSAGICVAVAIQ